MRDRLKTEFEAFAIYFLIAFTAELLGFMGWLNEMGRSGDVFTVENAFWVHELSRL